MIFGWLPIAVYLIGMGILIVYRGIYAKPPEGAPADWRRRELHKTLRYITYSLVAVSVVVTALTYFRI